MDFKVKYIGLQRSYESHKEELNKVFERVMSEGSFILRDDVREFEQSISSFLGAKYAVGVNSGTDALFLSCKIAGIKKGDEVLTVGHTFVATLSAIYHCGAKPILIDIADDYNIDVTKIEEKITKNTKAIIPVHLNGRACQMDKIVEIANKYDLIIIEDACQSVGAKYNNQHVGTFGKFGCFSLHPMKSLNCAGDGGYIILNDEQDYQRLISLRNHGQSSDKKIIYEYGYSSRLDNLQAAIANIRLKDLSNNNKKRRKIAQKYNLELSSLPLTLHSDMSNNQYYDVFNSYVIRTEKRDALYQFLIDNKIEVFIHIPQPLSEQKALNLDGSNLIQNKKISKEILSLPIYPELTHEELDYIILIIKKFFEEN